MSGPQHVDGHHLDTRLLELRLDELERLHTASEHFLGDETGARGAPRTRVDAVPTPSAARALEQAAGLGGAVAVHAPVRPVGTIAAPKERAVQWLQPRRRARRTPPARCDAIDSVRERTADELAPERGVAARADPDVEVLPPWRVGREEKLDAGYPPDLGELDPQKRFAIARCRSLRSGADRPCPGGQGGRTKRTMMLSR